MVPNDVLANMKEQQRNQFFEKRADGLWSCKTAADANEPFVPSTNPSESLKAILRRSNDNANYDFFVDLICKMLSYRPSERITPAQALNHSFITESEHSSHSRPVSAA